MSADSEKKRTRLIILFIGSLITAFLCASIYLFVTAYHASEKLVIAPLQSDQNQISSSDLQIADENETKKTEYTK